MLIQKRLKEMLTVEESLRAELTLLLRIWLQDIPHDSVTLQNGECVFIEHIHTDADRTVLQICNLANSQSTEGT